ncbi:MAG: OmpA family protein [Candidatus Kapaibacterium sp.]
MSKRNAVLLTFFSVLFITTSSAQQKVINVPSNMPRIEKVNLGDSINSPCGDLAPVISADGKYLFFGRYTENKENCDQNQKIWYCTRTKTGGWSRAIKMAAPLNKTGPNSVIAISPDTNFLLLMNQYNRDGSPLGGGISYTTRGKKNTWNLPQNITIEGFSNRNKYVNFFMSVDKSVLLMAVERDDSYGDLDIYVSFRLFDGYYSEPIGLGSTINTNKTELSPFLASDGKTLYFASTGHPGFGDADIFVSRRLDNTWQHWSEPINLGDQINTNLFDAYFTLTARGNEVYMVGNGIENSGDILRLELPNIPEIRPLPTTLLKGKVKNRNSQDPVSARIVYKNNNDENDWGYAITNPDDGTFQLALTNGSDYTIYADGNDAFPILKNFSTKDKDSYQEVEQEFEQINLPQLKDNPEFDQSRLTFQTGKTILKPEAQIEINRLVNFLKENPSMNVELAGFTDSKGSNELNKRISRQRAQAIANQLINKGINSKRIKTSGYGKNKPIGNNSTEEGRNLNRRVEFWFFEPK